LVPGRVTRAAALACLLLAALALAPTLADAANRRIAISNYKWSDPDIHIQVGQHVTWYWTGPDTLHSVTGTSANAKQWDSDPGTLPDHFVGDDYQVSFDQPGTYTFQCKLHSLVRGTITVTEPPGDSESEPDPIPKNNVDTKKPIMRDLYVTPKFGKKGAALKYSLSEKAKVDVEYYRFKKGKKAKKGKGGKKAKKKYAGYAVYKSYVGYNKARIGIRKPHFKPKPGRYMIEVRATDENNNTAKAQRLRFRIR
jgi:plastocyanin